MLGVALFVAFWVVLAFGLFFVAARGGLGGARAAVSRDTRSSGRVLGLITVIAVVGFGIALPAVLIVGNKDNANGQVAGYKLTASEKAGSTLFAEHCAVCHTLSENNAVGKVGPNLDMLKPPASLVLHTIAERVSAQRRIKLGRAVPRAGRDARAGRDRPGRDQRRELRRPGRGPPVVPADSGT